MIFQYSYTPCSLCGHVAICRSSTGETLRRCLPCIQATRWYQAMSPTGQGIVIRAFQAAELEVIAEQDRDARLRRLLAPVEARGTW